MMVMMMIKMQISFDDLDDDNDGKDGDDEENESRRLI